MRFPLRYSLTLLVALSATSFADTVIHENDWHYGGYAPVGGKTYVRPADGATKTSWLTTTFFDGPNGTVTAQFKANSIGNYNNLNTMRVEKVWGNVSSAVAGALSGLNITLHSHPGLSDPGAIAVSKGVNAFDSGGAGHFDLQWDFAYSNDFDNNDTVTYVLSHDTLALTADDFNHKAHPNNAYCYTAVEFRKRKSNGNYTSVFVAGDYTIVEPGSNNSGVPEPSSLLLWGLGLGAIGVYRRRRRKTA